jgi:integrase
VDQQVQRPPRSLKLTDRSVRTLPTVNGRTDYTDSLVRGFRLRVGVDGSRVYSVGYFTAGRWKRYTLGRIQDLTLAEAREAARRIRSRARLGEDPQAERLSQRRAGHTLADLIQRFEDKRGPEMRPRSFGEFQRIAKHDILPVLGLRQPEAITRADVRSLIDRIQARGAPTQANRSLASLRAVFRWSVRQDLISPAADPTVGITLPSEERPRDRVYTNDEIRSILIAVDGTELRHLVPLIFYTAVRSEEARAAPWNDFQLDRGLWTIPAEASKGGDPHPVPLSAGALRALERVHVASGKTGFLFPAETAPCRSCGKAGHMDVPNKGGSRKRGRPYRSSRQSWDTARQGWCVRTRFTPRCARCGTPLKTGARNLTAWLRGFD